MKTCTGCGEQKSQDNFYRNSRGYSDGFVQRCKRCYSVSSIERLYGLDRETYLAWLELGCSICKSKDFLQVDHDHACCPGRKSCGKCVRGLLCKRHNVLLGLLGDSLEELVAIEEYLTWKAQ